MNYTTVEEVVADLPPRLPPDLTSEYLLEQISQWSAYVDGYIAMRYTLPLSVVPPILATATRLLVTHQAHIKMGLYRGERNSRGNLWDQAHQILNDIKDGKLGLVGVDNPVAVSGGLPLTVSREDYDGTFGLKNQNKRFGGG